MSSSYKNTANQVIDEAGDDILTVDQRPLRFISGLNLSTAVTYIRLYPTLKAGVTIASDTTPDVIAVPPSAGFYYGFPGDGLDHGIISAWACTTESGATGAADAFIYYGWGA